MRIRFISLALPVAVLAALTPVLALALTEAEAHARIVPVAPEFPTAGVPSVVHAVVEIQDSGTSDVTEGEAIGMNPSRTYVSLIYSTPATGPTACDPGPPLTLQQMYLGVWHVNREGEGRLRSVKSHIGNTSPTPASLHDFLAFVGAPTNLSVGDSYAALGPNTVSVSVREVMLANGPPVAGLMVPQRIACGMLHVETED